MFPRPTRRSLLRMPSERPGLLPPSLSEPMTPQEGSLPHFLDFIFSSMRYLSPVACRPAATSSPSTPPVFSRSNPGRILRRAEAPRSPFTIHPTLFPTRKGRSRCSACFAPLKTLFPTRLISTQFFPTLVLSPFYPHLHFPPPPLTNPKQALNPIFRYFFVPPSLTELLSRPWLFSPFS